MTIKNLCLVYSPAWPLQSDLPLFFSVFLFASQMQSHNVFKGDKDLIAFRLPRQLGITLGFVLAVLAKRRQDSAVTVLKQTACVKVQPAPQPSQ